MLVGFDSEAGGEFVGMPDDFGVPCEQELLQDRCDLCVQRPNRL